MLNEAPFFVSSVGSFYITNLSLSYDKWVLARLIFLYFQSSKKRMALVGQTCLVFRFSLFLSPSLSFLFRTFWLFCWWKTVYGFFFASFLAKVFRWKSVWEKGYSINDFLLIFLGGNIDNGLEYVSFFISFFKKKAFFFFLLSIRLPLEVIINHVTIHRTMWEKTFLIM